MSALTNPTDEHEKVTGNSEGAGDREHRGWRTILWVSIGLLIPAGSIATIYGLLAWATGADDAVPTVLAMCGTALLSGPVVGIPLALAVRLGVRVTQGGIAWLAKQLLALLRLVKKIVAMRDDDAKRLDGLEQELRSIREELRGRRVSSSNAQLALLKQVQQQVWAGRREVAALSARLGEQLGGVPEVHQQDQPEPLEPAEPVRLSDEALRGYFLGLHDREADPGGGGEPVA